MKSRQLVWNFLSASSYAGTVSILYVRGYTASDYSLLLLLVLLGPLYFVFVFFSMWINHLELMRELRRGMRHLKHRHFWLPWLILLAGLWLLAAVPFGVAEVSRHHMYPLMSSIFLDTLAFVLIVPPFEASACVLMPFSSRLINRRRLREARVREAASQSPADHSPTRI